jgi:uncharacterized membrane protein YbhN (UPF0104 family)
LTDNVPLRSGGSLTKPILLKRVLSNILRNRWLSLFFLFLTVGFAIYYLVNRYSILMDEIKERPVSPGWLLFSFSCIMLAVIFGIFTWNCILHGFGYRLPWRKVLRMHIVPTLAKYIPGFVWQFSGKAYLAHESGVPVSIGITSIGIEVGLSLLSGIALFFLFFNKVKVLIPEIINKWVPYLFIIGIVLMVALWIAPIVVQAIVYRRKNKHAVAIHVGYWYLALVCIFLGWNLIAMAFYTSAICFRFTELSYWDSLIAICGAYVSGIMIVFVPNGLVVREAVLLALLPPQLNQAFGLLLSLLARVEVISCELIIGGIFLIGSIPRVRKKKSQDNK